MLQFQTRLDDPAPYAVEFENGNRRVSGHGRPQFTISISDEDRLDKMLKADDYSAAMDFVNGKFDIRGDIVGALRLRQNRKSHTVLDLLRTLAARIAPSRVETFLQGDDRASSNIQFHYDRSNEFYAKFLDSQFVYSCALFKDPSWSLEQAQSAKLDSICRKLDLQSGDRYLDVGCGWGALLISAAENYDVEASGCTLSHRQYEYATSAVAVRGLEGRVHIQEIPYWNLAGRYEKISSVGMFEHVGRHRLARYFRKMYALLEPGGSFLNSGITRPEPVADDAQTYFLQKEVFPGGELAHLSEVVRNAENARFQIVEVESHRMHYARTCREWVERLQQNAESCRSLAGDRTYRIWLLYLAASALNFEDGKTDVFQILMTKHSAASLRRSPAAKIAPPIGSPGRRLKPAVNGGE